MKFRITMKDPDGVGNGIDNAVADELDDLPLEDVSRFGNDGIAGLRDARRDQLQELLDTWFDFGDFDESMTVEIDTEAKTCVVVPRAEIGAKKGR